MATKNQRRNQRLGKRALDFYLFVDQHVLHTDLFFRVSWKMLRLVLENVSYSNYDFCIVCYH